MKIQAPRGTRDFYPAEMAWRNHLVDTWRRVSVRHGFEQVDGPIFETLDLYKVKSGEGIVSELFSFRRSGGSTDFAIRPEFTPTLARMVAARASSLPRPIKWFAVPNFCRAERPQRGRLREFWQWNVDLLGLEGPAADAEVLLVVVDFLAEMGLRPEHVRVKISHRDTVRHILSKMGVPDEKMLDAFDLLDRRDKLPPEVFQKEAAALGLDGHRVHRFEQTCRLKYPAGELARMKEHLGLDEELSALADLDAQLHVFGLAEWCEYDLGIVRGLAYYTGTVFEVHEAAGVERAIAGGGRYDRLIELFDGPATPAVGFGMGDVVISNVLADKGLLPKGESVAPRPDAFVFATSDAAAPRVPTVVAMLRRAGLHARMTYKTTRNVGKLIKDAAAVRSRCAVMLGEDAVELKDMASGEQRVVALADVVGAIRDQVAASRGASHVTREE
jgi:histidyl-tRNA synthetase